jgi:hypothetical protein
MTWRRLFRPGRSRAADLRNRPGHVRHHARDLLRLPRDVPDRRAPFLRFMSGWFNQKTGHVTVDLNQYEKNVANVRSWCGTNPNETVIAGLTRATGTVGK